MSASRKDIIDGKYSAFDRGELEKDAFFSYIYHTLRPSMMNFCYRFLGNTDEAEDVVAETMMKAYVKVGSYSPQTRNGEIASFSTWLHTIAANLCKSELRRRKKWKILPVRTYDGEEGAIDLEYGGPSPDSAPESDEIRRAVDEAVEHADIWPGYTEAFKARFFRDMNYGEIASMMEIPLGSAKSRVYRARSAAKKRLRHLARDHGIKVD